MAIANANAMATAIETYGRKIDVTVTHAGTVYTSADIAGFKMSAEGALLRSAMAQVDVELDGVGDTSFAASMVGEEISIVLTVTADGLSPERDFGMFIVREAEYDDDVGTIKLTAYDYMLRAMVPYTPVVDFGSESVTLGGYFSALCVALGLSPGATDFTNSEVLLDEDPFDDSYTFRDAFDAIAQAAGGIVAIRGGEVCVLYPTETGRTVDPSNLKSLKIGECYGPVNCVVLARYPQEDNLYRRDETAESWKEIRIENNPIMDSHRDDFINGLYTRLAGLTYYPTEITSYGVGWIELGDMYTLETTDGNTYTTMCLSDSWDVSHGMSETVIAEVPAKTGTDYTSADTTDRRINQTILRVDKQEQRIEALVSSTEQTKDALTGQLSELTKKVEATMTPEQVQILVEKEISGIDSVTTSTGFTFDENGMTVEKSGAGTKTTVDETGLTVADANGAAAEELLYAGVDGETGESVVKAKNIRVSKYLVVGKNSRFEDYEADGEQRTGCFFIG